MRYKVQPLNVVALRSKHGEPRGGFAKAVRRALLKPRLIAPLFLDPVAPRLPTSVMMPLPGSRTPAAPSIAPGAYWKGLSAAPFLFEYRARPSVHQRLVWMVLQL
jgi:hypothetical protein